MDARDLECLLERERGQEAGQPPGQHGLAGPGRTGEQNVVAPGRSDLEDAPTTFLATYRGEIRTRRLRRWGDWCNFGDRQNAAEVCGGFGEVTHGYRLDPRQSRFRG